MQRLAIWCMFSAPSHPLSFFPLGGSDCWVFQLWFKWFLVWGWAGHNGPLEIPGCHLQYRLIKSVLMLISDNCYIFKVMGRSQQLGTGVPRHVVILVKALIKLVRNKRNYKLLNINKEIIKLSFSFNYHKYVYYFDLFYSLEFF